MRLGKPEEARYNRFIPPYTEECRQDATEQDIEWAIKRYGYIDVNIEFTTPKELKKYLVEEYMKANKEELEDDEPMSPEELESYVKEVPKEIIEHYYNDLKVIIKKNNGKNDTDMIGSVIDSILKSDAVNEDDDLKNKFQLLKDNLPKPKL